MLLDNYIGIDRVLALLVLLVTAYDEGYKEINGALMARFVKATSLRYWYPEGRKLPNKDKFKEINPWYDAIFNFDLPQLKNQQFLEVSKGNTLWIKISRNGRRFARNLCKISHYKKLNTEASTILKESKKGLYPDMHTLLENLDKISRINHDIEAKIYDYLSTVEKYPVGVSISPTAVKPSIDLREWIKGIIERLKKIGVTRCHHDKNQIKFLLETCEKYKNAPVNEYPFIEVNGLVANTNVSDSDVEAFNLIIEGTVVKIHTPNVSLRIDKYDYHGFRVVGTPAISKGVLCIEAIRVFDKGKYYPTNGRTF